MKINRIELEHMEKSGFSSQSHEGIRHIKTLPYLSVVQAVEGSYDIQLSDGQVFNTGSGGFFIAPSDVQQTITHHADKLSKTMVCRWVFLKIKINGQVGFDDLYSLPVILPESFTSRMNAVFNRLFDASDPFTEYVCYYEIIRLLSQVVTEKTRPLSPHVELALTYIKHNYAGKLTVQDIAQNSNLSQSHLFCVFKKELGVSPMTYLNRYRISVAADALVKTDKTITEISDMVGIGDSVYFNKLFRRSYQMPPSQYRELQKNGRD